MIRFIVGLGLALGSIVGALALEGGNSLNLVGLSAFLMVWFVPFFASAAVWGYRNWARAWGAAFHPVEADVARRSVQVWKFNEFAFYLAGFLALLMGLILIFGNMDGVPTERLGRAFGAGLIAPLYGFFFGYLARILRARVESVNA